MTQQTDTVVSVAAVSTYLYKVKFVQLTMAQNGCSTDNCIMWIHRAGYLPYLYSLLSSFQWCLLGVTAWLRVARAATDMQSVLRVRSPC